MLQTPKHSSNVQTALTQKFHILLPRLLTSRDYCHKIRSKQIYQLGLKGGQVSGGEKKEGGKESESRTKMGKRSPMRLEKERNGRIERIEMLYKVQKECGNQKKKDFQIRPKRVSMSTSGRKSSCQERGQTLPTLCKIQNNIFQKESWQYYSRSKKINNHLSPLMEESDEEKQIVLQDSELKGKKGSYLTGFYVNLSKTQKFCDQSLKYQEQSILKNTCFQTLLKDYHSNLHDNSTARTRTSSNCSIQLMHKQDIPAFLLNYTPIHSSFNIATLCQSPLFFTKTFKNGIYFGQVLNKKRHGEGIFITDRSIFQGRFVDNMKFQGSERTAQGEYHGKMQNGLRDGEGEFKWNNGQKYTGMWKQGVKHGRGVWIGVKGDSYDGEWKEGRQEGKGVHKYRGSVYQGEFVNFLKQGKGREAFENGDVYVGEYREGKPNGWGMYEWKGGEKYEGEFVEGVRKDSIHIEINIIPAKSLSLPSQFQTNPI